MRQQLLLLAIWALGLTPLAATVSISPSSLPFALEFGAEALYWRGCEQGVEYAYDLLSVAAATVQEAVQHELQPGYGWGFRIFGNAYTQCPSRFVEIEWIHFRHTTTATVDKKPVTRLIVHSPFLLFRDASQVTAVQRDSYNNVSLRLAQNFCNGCWGRFYGYLGGGWREVFVRNRITAVESDVKFGESELKLSAGTLLFGFGCRANIGCGFGIETRGAFVAALGDLRFTHSDVATQSQVTAEAKRIESPQVTYIGGCEILASAHYVKDIGCVCVRAEAGYRLDYFFSLAAQKWFGVQGVRPPSEEVNHGYGGPFIGISACY